MHAIAFALALLGACAPGVPKPGDTAAPADSGRPDTAGGDTDTDTADTGPPADTADTAPDDTADTAPDDTACTPVTWWPDADRDGYGDTDGAVEACEAPAGTVATTGDCDDYARDAYPGGAEVCGDDIDQDCDGLFPGCGGERDVSLFSAAAAVAPVYTWFAGDLASLGDMDGDGLDDVGVIGSDVGVRDYLAVLPRLSGVVDPADAFARWETDEMGLFHAFVAPVGAVTGTGAPALAVAIRDSVLLWETPLAGGPIGEASYVLADDTTSGWAPLAADLVGPGDVDGDGHADLVASSRDETDYGDGAELTWIFRGPIDGDRVTSEAAAVITRETEGGRTDESELVPLGDQDGDGLADIGILSKNAALYVHAGDATGVVQRDDDAIGTIDLMLAASRRVPGAADYDGDGYADVAVYGSGTASTAYDAAGAGMIFRGPLLGSLTTADAWATWEGNRDYQRLGGTSAAVGDTDGDGADDLLLASDVDGGDAAAWLFTGLAPGAFGPTDAARVVRGGALEAGSWVAAAGDHDGDGLHDFLVGGYDEGASTMWIGLFLGE